ncbi:hypothetical protein CU633_21405 [Bacillus sp. V3-13]|nr:hypothetical protein CU633_21405 [Bacillus sp. V3-13]
MPFYPRNARRRTSGPFHIFGPRSNARGRRISSSRQGPTGSINKIMSHAGKITNGINMVNQVRSILSLFK